jgi:iron(III) transport system permease protein
MGLALLVLMLEGWSRGRSSYHRPGPGSDRPPKVVALGRWRWPAFALCGLIAGLSLALPTGVLLHWLVRGALSGEPMLLLWSAARNSVVASGLAAAAAAGLSIPMAALIVRYPSPLSRLLERVSFIGYSLPGVVVALALAFFGANFAQPLYQTTWLLVFAYVVLLFPAALGATRASLHQVSPRLEEAARGLGRTPGQAIQTVTAPLVRPGLMMGAALVFLVAMKELPATLILGPLGFETLATAVWSASSEAFFARAAAPALTLILVSSIPMAYLILRERRVSLTGGA